MTTAVATRTDPPKAIVAIKAELEKREADLLAVLPHGMDVQRFIRVSLLAISKNPDILRCTPGSIIRSIVEAAEIGLEPTGSLNRAWLVPFKDKESGKDEAQLMIGYQGYADLMRDSGRVTRITAEVVFEGDQFRVVKGSSEPRIEHEPSYATEDPSKITHAYAVAWFADGESQFEVMTKAQVDQIRGKSRQRNGKPWTEGYPQMARKTALRRLSNYVPLSARAQQAIARDDEREFASHEPSERVSRTASVRTRVRARRERPEPVRNAPQSDGAPPEAPAASTSDSSAAQQTTEGATRDICGAQSDPALGEVDTCVLDPGHLEPEGAAQRHQSAAGSVWPA